MGNAAPPTDTVGVVVLTQGRRPIQLRAALNSVLIQQGVTVNTVVVGNGWDPSRAEPPMPPGVRTMALATNQGIPAGRNAGVVALEDRTLSGKDGGRKNDWLLFLDDDATLIGQNFLQQAIALMKADSSIGLVQPRVEVHDAGGGVVETPDRWIPRLRKGDPRVSSPIMSCWEGAVVMPTKVFHAAGGWAEPFFYAHEGIELAWRVWGLGLRAWYAGELTATHPQASPTRHSQYYRLNARNRVWIARRNLPFALGLAYIATWTLIQVLRGWRHPAALGAWFAGWREGWRVNPGGRCLLSWRTIYRMTRAGRPPII